jgi:hypothetical protein
MSTSSRSPDPHRSRDCADAANGGFGEAASPRREHLQTAALGRSRRLPEGREPDLCCGREQVRPRSQKLSFNRHKSKFPLCAARRLLAQTTAIADAACCDCKQWHSVPTVQIGHCPDKLKQLRFSYGAAARSWRASFHAVSNRRSEPKQLLSVECALVQACHLRTVRYQ